MARLQNNSPGNNPVNHKNRSHNETRTHQLRSFMGSIHHLIKFIPKLAELIETKRPLLKKKDNKNARLNWNEIHSQVFENIKQKNKTIY